jgi:hypothetical protein
LNFPAQEYVVERSENAQFGLEMQGAADYVLANPASLPPRQEHTGLWRAAVSGAASVVLGLALLFGDSGLDVSVSGTRAALQVSQPMAAKSKMVSRARTLPGLSSELMPSSDSDRPTSAREQRAERLRAKKEAAKAKREAAHEKHLAAAQARREAAAEKKEAAKAKHAEAHEKYAAAAQSRREAAEARKEAAKAKREAAHERYVAAAQSRREAAEEKNSGAKAKREAAHEKYAAAMQARREAAEEKNSAAKAKKEAAHEKYVAAMQARRDAAEERRRAAQEKKDAAKQHREPESVAQVSPSPSQSSAGFGDSKPFAGGAGNAAASGTMLRINSLPWAQVYVDGRMVGNTPQRALSVSPGEHEIRLLNPAFDMGATFRVKVARGQKVTRGVMLEEQ